MADWNRHGILAKIDMDAYAEDSGINNHSHTSASSNYDPSGLENYTPISPDIDYQDDIEDVKMLEDMRKRPLVFRKFEEFMEEYGSGKA